jgi:hypothetical protein
VQRHDRSDRDRYYIHGDLYKALARIRARALLSASSKAALAGRNRPSVVLKEYRGQIEDKRSDRSHKAEARARSFDDVALDSNVDQSNADLSIPQEVIDTFARELGITSDYLADLLASPHGDIGSSVAKLMSRLCDREFLFRGEIEHLLQGKQEAIASALATLAQSDEPSIQSGAQRVAEYLGNILDLLLFAENGDYEWALPHILEKARRTSEQAFPAEQREKWIGLVQDHYDQIRRQPRRDSQDWGHVIDLLREVSDGLGKLQEADAPSSQPKHMHS